MKCMECDSNMKEGLVELEKGVRVRGFICPKCGESEFTEEQLRAALALKESTLKLRRKIGKVGASYVIRLPKDIVYTLHLHEGEDVSLWVEHNKIILEPIEA